MSKADDMFEKLGYKKTERTYTIDYYKFEKRITFEKTYKEIVVCDFYRVRDSITIQELQAINQKCKELEWLDE